MKLIIAGSRNFDPNRVYLALLYENLAKGGSLFGETEIVSGGASGVDAAGERYGMFCELPVQKFIPDWTQQGRAAGPLRNRKMAEYGDVLLLIWDGKSKGSASMKREMEAVGKTVHEWVWADGAYPDPVDFKGG